jgi:hypothetical protein
MIGVWGSGLEGSAKSRAAKGHGMRVMRNVTEFLARMHYAPLPLLDLPIEHPAINLDHSAIISITRYAAN